MLTSTPPPITTERTKPVLAFDVYGTLIDPFHMEEHLRAAFGDRAKEASELWRSKQLEFSFRRALMKKYQDFNACTAQALRYVCEQFGISLSSGEQQDLLEQYLRLPAYPDVSGILKALKDDGFKIVACSNGTENAVHGLLEHAGVLPQFSGIVSVDKIRTYKPDPAVYEYLVDQVHMEKEMVWLISSNAFDVIGAKAYGLRTAWVQRDPKRVFDPWEFKPDIIVHSLEELPKQLRSTG
jgi:2-haloacid dehalogenase